VILAFGDSITYGVGRARGRSYPDLLANSTDLKVINAGVSGDTAARAKSRIAPLMDQHTPDLVILELGGNDFLARRSAAQVKEDLHSLLTTITSRNVKVILVSVPEFSVFRATTGRLRDSPIYEELASEFNIILAPNILSETLSDKSLRSDPIHPNAEGYEVFASRLYKRMVESGLI